MLHVKTCREKLTNVVIRVRFVSLKLILEKLRGEKG
jgi:hypothetical protein